MVTKKAIQANIATYIKLNGRYYPGGLTATSYSDLMIDRSDQVVRNAITGMLPKNRLGRQMATKLKVYAGAEHPHAAQKPVPFEITQVSQ